MRIRLCRPQVRDTFPVQHLITGILFDCELTKRISSMRIEIYIDLQKHRKVSVNAGLSVVVTFRRVRSLASMLLSVRFLPCS